MALLVTVLDLIVIEVIVLATESDKAVAARSHMPVLAGPQCIAISDKSCLVSNSASQSDVRLCVAATEISRCK